MIIGLDMGGTNIDAVIIENDKIIKSIKKAVDYNNMFESILKVIVTLIKDININDIKRINLSTTILTNAIVENNVSKVGLIVQTGPGLNEEYYNKYDNIYFISGYTDHRGIVVKTYNDSEIDDIIRAFKNDNINNVGIITKFSTRNNETELKLKAKLNKHFKNITLGHKMSGKLNFPRRINTSYLNASVKSLFNEFVNNILKAFKQLKITAPINVLKADGGIIDIIYAKNIPVETIMSGPSASLMGMLALNESQNDAILIDIGGTTTDVFFLADGIPLFEPIGIEISNYKTLIRAIYSKSIGLGGDSFVRVIDGKVLIGPERLDKAMAFGGKYLTPTDALVVLGKINKGNRSLASKGIKQLSSKLNMNELETAALIVRKFVAKIKENIEKYLTEINNKPVYTIKEILNNKQITPQEIILIGGPANSFKSYLSDEFNLKVKCPKNYDVANAIGAALSKTTAQITLTANTETKILMIPALGIKETIDDNFNLNDAKKYAIKALEKQLINLGNKDHFEIEIIEASSFNMVSGFYTKGVNIRVQAQVKPGLSKRIGAN